MRLRFTNRNKFNMTNQESAFMEPEEIIPFEGGTDYQSVNMHDQDSTAKRYFNLINPDEECLATNLEQFLKYLNEKNHQQRIKVISIFGKIGDGKSHTLNNIIFDGEEVFQMSSEQGVCTKGIQAAYHNEKHILCLDTEGMSASSGQENNKTRLLWKILAISDIVIFRTRSEKLQDDMYLFLGHASKAFKEHFSETLYGPKEYGGREEYSEENSYNNGDTFLPNTIIHPSILIFHETMNTKVVTTTVDTSADEIIKNKFAEKNLQLSSFRSLKYYGIQTNTNEYNQKKYTSRDKDKHFTYILEKELEQITPQRTLEGFFNQINQLTHKFSKPIDNSLPPFSLKILECGIKCKVCHERCQKSSNHEGEKHKNFLKECFYDQKYENKLRLCKKCFEDKNEEIIVNQTTTAHSDETNSLWSVLNFNDSTINCKNCGVIFKNGWFSSRPPFESIIHTKIVHVWPGGDFIPKGPSHSGQKVIDGISSIKETVSNYTSEPTKIVSNWIINKVNPSYWRNDNEIRECKNCLKNFHISGLPKHHCRKCGEGFCNGCSLKRTPVPEYGWTSPSRVCDSCYTKLTKNSSEITATSDATSLENSAPNESDTIIRRYSEAVFSTVKPASWLVEQSLNYIKYKTQPEYWVPDEKAPKCYKCNQVFGLNNDTNTNQLKRHHCRSCGNAFCDNCSKGRIPVPDRGWEYDVRVCDKCIIERKQKQT